MVEFFTTLRAQVKTIFAILCNFLFHTSVSFSYDAGEMKRIPARTPLIFKSSIRPLPVILGAFLSVLSTLAASPSIVSLKTDASGNHTLVRNGEPYHILGVGGTSRLNTLVECGGNSIRTWGIESLEKPIEGVPLLDHCQKLGITVTAGIWIGHKRHGFDYSDKEQLEKQRVEVREAVRKYRDHPALLMWGLGNEMEGPTSDGKDADIWKELNVLAAIIKEEDANHPVMTVIAGSSSNKVKGILEHYPNIDILGVNAYAGASGAPKAVKQAGWTKPLVLTEFGTPGHWEVPKTPWGAPIEPTSREKAANYYSTISLLNENRDICLGSYAFLWGQKQETTSTWYGMFLESGEKLPSVDAMCYAWTGKWPANRTPRVESFESALDGATLPPGTEVEATMVVKDREGDTLEWEWYVAEESRDVQVGGDKENAPPVINGCISQAKDGNVKVKIPSKPGAYRLYAIVRDGKGGASAENMPFRVAN